MTLASRYYAGSAANTAHAEPTATACPKKCGTGFQPVIHWLLGRVDERASRWRRSEAIETRICPLFHRPLPAHALVGG